MPLTPGNTLQLPVDILTQGVFLQPQHFHPGGAPAAQPLVIFGASEVGLAGALARVKGALPDGLKLEPIGGRSPGLKLAVQRFMGAFVEELDFLISGAASSGVTDDKVLWATFLDLQIRTLQECRALIRDPFMVNHI